MSVIFHGATEFNGYVSSCDTSGVTDMSTMFQGEFNFHNYICGWDTAVVTYLSAMARCIYFLS